MSTRAIRELAEYVKSHFAAGELLADEALKEAENIERAAKVVALQGVFEHPDDDADCLRGITFAEEVMESIAKDAP